MPGELVEITVLPQAVVEEEVRALMEQGRTEVME
jgi:hypothetical protein